MGYCGGRSSLPTVAFASTQSSQFSSLYLGDSRVLSRATSASGTPGSDSSIWGRRIYTYIPSFCLCFIDNRPGSRVDTNLEEECRVGGSTPTNHEVLQTRSKTYHTIVPWFLCVPLSRGNPDTQMFTQQSWGYSIHARRPCGHVEIMDTQAYKVWINTRISWIQI